MFVIERFWEKIDFFTNLNKLQTNGIKVFKIIHKRIFCRGFQQKFYITDVIQNFFKNDAIIWLIHILGSYRFLPKDVRNLPGIHPLSNLQIYWLPFPAGSES